MDRIKRTSDIIRSYYNFKRTNYVPDFIKEVCRYFDEVKNEPLSDSDLSLLIFLANEVGLPQYFKLLENKFTSNRITEESMNALTVGAFIHEASLLVGEQSLLHRYQKDILQRFTSSHRNRYILTAPTSFGKTFLVYEIIKKMDYRNVLLIFPAISLLSENYVRLCNSTHFSTYKIHTLSEEEFTPEEKNIFIFTPERYLSFMDSHPELNFDFAFIDEIYKIDNGFVIDQETRGENERDIAYRLALEFISRRTQDMFLAGPYMNIVGEDPDSSFYHFVTDNCFTVLAYNDYEIVEQSYFPIKNRQVYSIDQHTISMPKGKLDKTIHLIKGISFPQENTIVYCGRRSDTERYTKALLQNTDAIQALTQRTNLIESPIYRSFLEHLEQVFGEDWIVVKALKQRIGIHHSLIPKYIQKEIINLFNRGILLCLFSTTTITEGVNTTAKNVIITSNKKGSKILKPFDAKNIAGRAGRFSQHYRGRIIDLSPNFTLLAQGTPEVVNHKNYDLNSPKTDVDYQITEEQYLSNTEQQDKQSIQDLIEAVGIPSEVIGSFKVVGPRSKLDLYNRIQHLTEEQCTSIENVSRRLISSNLSKLDWAGFQMILDVIEPIITEEKLKEPITRRVGTAQYSLLTVLVSNYLSGGFLGMVDYYVRLAKSPLTKDEAVRKVSDFVYNIFKYHLVKYLGVFDILYRYHRSIVTSNEMDDILGLGSLLQKLEYNALTPIARKISDYGVPFKLVKHYDVEHPSDNKEGFDSYEHYIDEQINANILQHNN